MKDTENTLNEVWEPVEGFEDYHVSNKGNVKSFKNNRERLLKPWKDTRGYVQVYLCKEGKRKPVGVHRLVMLAFKGLNEERPTVNHLNGVLDDNRLENLEWTTQKENNNHAFDSGLMENAMGERRSVTGLSNEQAVEICKLYLEGKTHVELAKIFNVKKYHISNIVHGKSFRRVTRELRNKYMQ